MSDARRALPSVGALLESPALRPLLDRASRAAVTEAVRDALHVVRTHPQFAPADPASPAAWLPLVQARLEAEERSSLRPVINATGVVLHTNLGRAPLADAAVAAIERVARGSTTLEYDLDAGTRGSRHGHCAPLLRALTGAEDAMVVNNGAAALVLALDALAAGREAIVSRGELVEIGGSFRVPEIMAKSGARLVEVGTTNRTHLADYAGAIGAATGAMVKVHRSNFALEGFVAEVSVSELAALGRERGLPVIHDLGSGLLAPLDDVGLRGEPTASDSVRAGADLVTMSGDKLLGGPQAGILVGTRAAVERVRRSPLARSYRVDKLTLAALEATLRLHRDPARARREIPALAMLTAPVEALRLRATALGRALGEAGIEARVVESEATVGGGAFPTARIPSVAIAIGGRAARLEARLRAGEPAVVGRIANDALLLDLRAVLPREDEALREAIVVACAALDASHDLPSE
ncbi:MAG: L-seryl-tRNA(Sec) selenium transferase [Gemmatimonadaceae bacterium]